MTLDEFKEQIINISRCLNVDDMTDIKNLINNLWQNKVIENEQKAPRICSECGKEMHEGYVIENGLEYYCSDDCLYKHYSDEEFDELYDDGNGDSYWTEWEER